MKTWFRFLGSLRIAVPLLVTIASVLAWGTIYETRFGTASVQRFIYQAWWFQLLLGFLGVNLAIAALQRYPWKRRHVPFVLAHLGIILILFGGILGGRFGVEGQLIIPEGQAERILDAPGNVLMLEEPNPGVTQLIPLRFETQAWVHEPQLTVPVELEGRRIQVTVDRYYPDAVVNEQITDDGDAESPAVLLRLLHQGQQDEVWLFARDPERFGVGWGQAHALFLEPETDAQRAQLLGRPAGRPAAPRGTLAVTLPSTARAAEIAVPARMGGTVPVKGTPYRLTFKDYFADFAITEQGPVSRSDEPNNPAVAVLLAGPEGTDAFLLFALHPDFQAMHGMTHTIPATIAYTHDAAGALPPNAIAIIQMPGGAFVGMTTNEAGTRALIEPLEPGQAYTHPSLGYEFTVAAAYARARRTPLVTNRSNEVKAEAVHVIAEEGAQRAEAWLRLREAADLPLGDKPVRAAFQPNRRELPFAVKLLDFRKIDYPGTEMAAGFESDVEVVDARRGLTLMRKISMNHPLRYRGYSLYQSSYVPGPTETTVVSVRNDPGTPFVYAGFLIVMSGVISLFATRRDPGGVAPRRTAAKRRGTSARGGRTS